MKKAKIISAILSLALIATHSTAIIPSVSSKTRHRHLTAYAYSENVSGNWIQDKDTGKWWFKHDDGSYTKNSWEKIEDIWYHFDMYGWMQTGWLKDGDKWYYLDPNGAMHMGWKQINTTWYYFTSNGTMYNTGWLKDNGKYYYLNPSGAMHTGWKKIDGNWYYLDPNGAMHTGWKEIDGKWYYFNSNGIMLKDWLTLNNKKYYLGTDGVMYVGLKQVEGKYYYFNENGTMRTGTGWFTDTNGKKYYFNSDGTAHTGWLSLDNKKYYFNSDGTAHTGWLSLDNKKYNFDKNGIMQTGWLEENGKKYFLYNTGEAAIGCSPTSYDHTDSWFNYTGWHNFDSNGAMIESDGNGEPMVLLFDWYIQDSAELSAKHIQPLKKGDFVYCTDTVKKEYYGNTGVYAKINYENRISGYVLMYDDLAVSNSDCTICTGRPGIVLEEADKKFKKYFS